MQLDRKFEMCISIDLIDIKYIYITYISIEYPLHVSPLGAGAAGTAGAAGARGFAVQLGR